ncbi:DEAD/DEAH box helicase [Rheinheimera sp. UJ63]|uniref:DEAD/DEAH box helicase n=1 Tax=Rheinheimera sp. UJ63 TaxID=2910157 RepID=UPI001F27F8D3|nr:DEAD/DEAH box helicase [Rheinheimera sp. UJ63]MCF4007988.1 DEAD/DEAH box helicase [Rheinheimera sp. UJ63]
MVFQDLGLDPRLLRSVQHLGFATPTEIQQEAIPAVLVGRDLMVSSKTGSGKTLAYLLPMMQRLLKSRPLSKQDARALILAPTRELAKQVYAQLRLFVSNTPVTAALIVGGENFNDQEKLLKRQPTVIVATPGRFLDHLEHKSVFLQGLEMLILDEADRMLDLGFMPQLNAINKAAEHRLRQTLLFSATLDHTEVDELTVALLKNPFRVALGSGHEQHSDIQQQFMFADNLTHKEALLAHVLKHEPVKQLIIFTATRDDAERLATVCVDNGFSAMGLSARLNQGQRNAVMQQFAAGKYQVLVTTDLASRGLDLLQVTHVINFDLPKHPEEYVHRIGRTGRAGAKGQAFSLVGPKDWASLQKIEGFLRRPAEFSEVEGLVARFKGPTEPVEKAGKAAAKSAKSTMKAKHSGKPSAKTVKKAPAKVFFQGGDDGSAPVRRKKTPQD